MHLTAYSLSVCIPEAEAEGAHVLDQGELKIERQQANPGLPKNGCYNRMCV